MSNHKGWIGVDLDATLAVYSGWQGLNHIGEPIPAMVERVKRWIAEGKNVRVMTARVARSQYRPNEEDVDTTRAAIKAWCLEHIGTELEVTNQKDFSMIELWDDRAVQVVPNTGERVDETRPGVETAAKALLADVRRRYPGEALRCPYMIALDDSLA